MEITMKKKVYQSDGGVDDLFIIFITSNGKVSLPVYRYPSKTAY